MRRGRRFWRERAGRDRRRGERFAFDRRVGRAGLLRLDAVNGQERATDALENPGFPGHLGESSGLRGGVIERQIPAHEKLAKAEREDVEEPLRREAGFGKIAIALGERAGGVEAFALGEPLEVAALTPVGEVTSEMGEPLNWEPRMDWTSGKALSHAASSRPVSPSRRRRLSCSRMSFGRLAMLRLRPLCSKRSATRLEEALPRSALPLRVAMMMDSFRCELQLRRDLCGRGFCFGVSRPFRALAGVPAADHSFVAMPRPLCIACDPLHLLSPLSNPLPQSNVKRPATSHVESDFARGPGECQGTNEHIVERKG
jgi:hypothetical protein